MICDLKKNRCEKNVLSTDDHVAGMQRYREEGREMWRRKYILPIVVPYKSVNYHKF